jgi:uncharacterized protein
MRRRQRDWIGSRAECRNPSSCAGSSGNPRVAVLEYQDGLIRRYREYGNPLALLEAPGDPNGWVKEPGRG